MSASATPFLLASSGPTADRHGVGQLRKFAKFSRFGTSDGGFFGHNDRFYRE